jgi:hypothetical protein
VPGPIDFLRLAALAVFLALVAVGLWLLDVEWWVIPPVMVVALFVAWTIEWLAWRQGRPLADVEVAAGEADVVSQALGYSEPLPAPAQAIQPPSPPQPETLAPPPPPPEPEPELVPAPEPAAEAEPEPVPVPETPPEPAAAPAPEPEEPARPPRRPLRVRLRPVPSPRPQPEPESQPEPEPALSPSADAAVVTLRPRTFEPRQWNLWDLERIAREQRPNHPERRDEWSYLFLHLRQFADADGSLPTEFDALVRESFGGLLEPSHRP